MQDFQLINWVRVWEWGYAQLDKKWLHNKERKEEITVHEIHTQEAWLSLSLSHELWPGQWTEQNDVISTNMSEKAVHKFVSFCSTLNLWKKYTTHK